MSPSPYPRYRTPHSTSKSSQLGIEVFNGSPPMTPASLPPVIQDDQAILNDNDGSFEATDQRFEASTASLETHSHRVSRIDPRLENQAVGTYFQNSPGAGLQEYTSSYCFPGSEVHDVGLRQEQQEEWTNDDQHGSFFQVTHHLATSDNRNNPEHLDVQPRHNCQYLAEPENTYDNKFTTSAFSTVLIPAEPSTNVVLPRSIYRPYSATFVDSAAAKAHRKSARKGPRLKDLNFDIVKTVYRGHWVHRLHESMIDISNVQDGPGGDGYKRFISSTKAFYENKDLEAAAHEVFDAVIDLYEQGFTLPLRYDLTPKYGDDNLTTVEERLECICNALKKWKTICVDVMDGGWKIRKMVNHPPGYVRTKEGNKNSNGKRKETIQAGQEVLTATKTSALTKQKQIDSGADESLQEPARRGKKVKAKSKRTRSKKISTTLSHSTTSVTHQSPETNHANLEFDDNQHRDQLHEKLRYGELCVSGNTSRPLQQLHLVSTSGLQKSYSQMAYENSALVYDHLLNQKFEAAYTQMPFEACGDPTSRLPHPDYGYVNHPLLGNQRQQDLSGQYTNYPEHFSLRTPFSSALSTLNNSMRTVTHAKDSPIGSHHYHCNAHEPTTYAVTNSSGSLQSLKKRGRDENDDIPQIAGSTKPTRQI